MEQQEVVLAINPGSTTTKLALFHRDGVIAEQVHDHTVEQLDQFATVYAQFSFRRDLILRFLDEHQIKPGTLSVIMGRGGLLHPLLSGVYRINPMMLRDLEQARYGEHACNLGAPLADAIAKRYGCDAMIADPVVVDEMIDLARISGMPDIPRKSIFHALNQKYVARKAAKQLNIPYEQARLIVAHLGGGISVGAHCNGRVIDVNNALDGEGPLTPERSGGLPAGDLVRLVYSGKYNYEQLKKKIIGSGGLYAYTGTRDLKSFADRAQSGKTEEIFWIDVLVYQICKEIASLFAVLSSRVDAVVLTGAIAHNTYITERINGRIGTLAPLLIFPGEGEMQSLAENAFAVLDGVREVLDYEGP
jgi:butyrate kinase